MASKPVNAQKGKQGFQPTGRTAPSAPSASDIPAAPGLPGGPDRRGPQPGTVPDLYTAYRAAIQPTEDIPAPAQTPRPQAQSVMPPLPPPPPFDGPPKGFSNMPSKKWNAEHTEADRAAIREMFASRIRQAWSDHPSTAPDNLDPTDPGALTRMFTQRSNVWR